MAEKFFWADEIANQIIKEKGRKKEYVCASGITPSGTIHIGNFREVITTDLVVRALRDKGKKVRFIYSWDDYDRFRKVPKNVGAGYEKYIGMALSEIPSPFEKNKFIDKITGKKINNETMRLLEIQKDSMIKFLMKIPKLYYTKSHFPLEISQRAFDHLWRVCESYEMWCKEMGKEKLIKLNLN